MRKNYNLAPVALANKLARVWVVSLHDYNLLVSSLQANLNAYKDALVLPQQAEKVEDLI
jgi:hypothetical protein